MPWEEAALLAQDLVPLVLVHLHQDRALDPRALALPVPSLQAQAQALLVRLVLNPRVRVHQALAHRVQGRRAPAPKVHNLREARVHRALVRNPDLASLVLLNQARLSQAQTNLVQTPPKVVHQVRALLTLRSLAPQSRLGLHPDLLALVLAAVIHIPPPQAKPALMALAVVRILKGLQGPLARAHIHPARPRIANPAHRQTDNLVVLPVSNLAADQALNLQTAVQANKAVRHRLPLLL